METLNTAQSIISFFRQTTSLVGDLWAWPSTRVGGYARRFGTSITQSASSTTALELWIDRIGWRWGGTIPATKSNVRRAFVFWFGALVATDRSIAAILDANLWSSHRIHDSLVCAIVYCSFGEFVVCLLLCSVGLNIEIHEMHQNLRYSVFILIKLHPL